MKIIDKIIKEKWGLKLLSCFYNCFKIDTKTSKYKIEIETTEGDRIILETNLIHCGNRNSIYNNIITRHELDTNSSELDCTGGLRSKLYLIDYE